VFPIVWVAVQVHDGEDEYAVRLDAVQHAIGKTANKTALRRLLANGPRKIMV